MSLEDIKARAEAATSGPWETDHEGWIYMYDKGLVNVCWTSEDDSGITWKSNADEDFVEHARTDITKLVAALEAVLAEHVEIEAEYARRGKPLYRQECRVCRHEYPCPTLRAITEALA